MPLLRELTGATSAFALVVCGALLLVSFNVGIPGQALLQSLRFHIAAGLLLLVLVLFLLRAWIPGLLFLVVFALSVGQGAMIIFKQQEAWAAVASKPSKPLLKVLVMNVLQTNFGNGGRIAEFIVASGADVVFVMEAGPLKDSEQRLAEAYPYRSPCLAGACDAFMLSKTPLTEVRVGQLSQVWKNRLVTAKTEVQGTTVNLVGAHMVKPYFDEFAEEEAYRLNLAIEKTEGPLVLMGDFNSAAWSRNIDRLAERRSLIPGPAYPATWPVRLGPLGVPIDNLWTRGPLFISSIRALDDAMGSNHRGLEAELSLVETQ